MLGLLTIFLLGMFPISALNIVSSDPKFVWLSERDSNGLPSMQITFADGHKDIMRLRNHNPLPNHHDPCLFLGTLAGEAGAVAAVTGCPGHKKVQITLLSRYLNSNNNQFTMDDMGMIEAIPSPWNDATSDIMRVVRSNLNKADSTSEESGSTSAENNSTSSEVDSTSNESDSTSDENGSMSNETVRLGNEGKWHKNGDEEINDELEDAANAAAAMCSGANRQVQACNVASEHKMTLNIAYDSSLASKETNTAAWIAKVVTHTQVFFHEPSLKTKINLMIKAVKSYPSLTLTATGANLNTLKATAKTDPNVNLWVFLCHDTASYYGTVGIAWVGTMCRFANSGYHVSINEWRNSEASTAKVVAHEIGHNVGMSHDFDSKNSGKSCTGIMDYGTTPDTWSSCSYADFSAHYQLVLQQKGQHCMEVVTGGSTTTGGSTSSTTSTTPPANTCQYPQWSKDAWCDDGNNNAGCNWDGGACCPPHKVSSWKKYCNTCACLDPNIPSRCQIVGHKGDGYCDDYNNNKGCDYDGGDCCNNTKTNWNYFCKACKCLKP